jgi:hypothetical protein
VNGPDADRDWFACGQVSNSPDEPIVFLLSFIANARTAPAPINPASAPQTAKRSLSGSTGQSEAVAFDAWTVAPR